MRGVLEFLYPDKNMHIKTSSERSFHIMAVRGVEFSSGSTKLERFLHKNQRTQTKLLNFEFWINGELSKVGHHFSNKKIYFIKKCQ